MNIKELLGREVLDANAVVLGKVSDVDFDIHKGIINHVVVKAGIMKRYEVSFNEIARIGDKILLNTSEKELTRKTTIGM